MTAKLAIPAICADRPTVGGYVIPWVNVQLADGGVDFRSQHDARTQRCWKEGRCQLCSRVIETLPVVLMGGPERLAKLLFDEPPLHPECAAYVSHACPMVAGRMRAYRNGEPISRGPRGSTCPKPGCNCGGWTQTPGTDHAAADKTSHDWYAVYANGYALAVGPERRDRIHSGAVQLDDVRAVRLVSTPDGGRVWKRVPDWRRLVVEPAAR